MNPKTTGLIARINRLDAEIDRVSGLIPSGASQRRMVRRLRTASTGAEASYRADATSYGDQFIVHIAGGARHARRLSRLLKDVIQLQRVPIEAIREVIL